MNSIKKWEIEEQYREFKKENFEKTDRFAKRLDKILMIIFRIAFIIDLLAVLFIFISMAQNLSALRNAGGILKGGF